MALLLWNFEGNVGVKPIGIAIVVTGMKPTRAKQHRAAMTISLAVVRTAN